MRRIVHIGAVMATTAAIVPALAGFNPALAPVVADSDEDGAKGPPLIVERISPKSVGNDSRVRIEGQVTNTTDNPIEDVTVRFEYSRYPLGDRSELAEFASGDGSTPDAKAAEADLGEPLKPGESADYTLRADVSELSLPSWGVYPVVVEAVDGSGGDIGRQRTFLPYRGGGSSPEPLNIAWVWPLSDQPNRADDNTFLGDSLAESLSPEGRLGRLLTVGAQDDEVSLEPESPAEQTSPSPTTPSAPASPSEEVSAPADAEEPADEGREESDEDSGVPITWAVDPGLLADIDRLTSPHQLVEDPQAAAESADSGGEPQNADQGNGEEGSGIATTTVQASPNARIWLDQARAALAEDSVVTTPYASADIAALLRHGLADDADASVALGQDTVERVLDAPADETVALPPNGLMNTETREFYQRHGASTFLLRDPAMPPGPWHEATPTAQAPLSLGKGEKGTALVADGGLADVLSQDTSGPGEAALAQQRFAAETAMIAGEDAQAPRTIVAYPPMNWSPSADFAEGLLDSSQSLPWLEPVDLADVRPGDSSSGEGRQSLTYPKEGTRAELDKSYLEKVKDVRGRVRLFNSILADGADPFRPAILRLESTAWRSDKDVVPAARALVSESVEHHTNQVHIIPTEPVTLASSTGTIGVLVANDLKSHPVRVNLSLLSGNPERLSIDDFQDDIEIGPNRKTTVYVPLSARVNGRTMIQMNLHNYNGEPIAEEQYLSVNATGMGAQALVISGIGALVLVAALTPRALRKWARNRASDKEDNEDAAAGPGDGDGDDGDGGTGDGPDPEPNSAAASASAPEPGTESDPAAGMHHNEEESAGAPPADSASAPSEDEDEDEDTPGGAGDTGAGR